MKCGDVEVILAQVDRAAAEVDPFLGLDTLPLVFCQFLIAGYPRN